MDVTERLAEIKEYLESNITGAALKSAYASLVAEGEGCWSFCYAGDEKLCYFVCMGWHDMGDDPTGGPWEVFLKIGRQSRKSIMQCDFDLDFDMPWYEGGELYDTLTPVAPLPVNGDPNGKPMGYENWGELADFAKESAMYAFKTFGNPEEEPEDWPC